MAKAAMLGSKVRHLRQKRQLAQIDMARSLGISPSYLNLIEHNQRPLTIPLLLKLASAFDIDLQDFSEDEEARLLAELTELFGDPMFQDQEPVTESLSEIVATGPGLCRAILALYRAYRNARDDIQTLSDRLTDESFLSTSAHELRTLLTSIRSFSEILHEHEDIDAEQRQKFVTIMARDSGRLTGVVNQMLKFASADGHRPSGSDAPPGEDVTDFIHDHNNHFPALEDAADAFRRDAKLGTPVAYATLVDILDADHGVRVEIVPGGPDPVLPRRFDADGLVLHLSEILPPASRCFQAARKIGLLSLDSLFAEQLTGSRLSSPGAQDLGRGVLADYFAGALLMPYDVFLESARSLRYDIDLLGHRFASSFEQTCHRLATLQQSGVSGVPFHFLRLDIAGNISKRFSASGQNIPRYGRICPRWAIHAAFLAPGRIHRQVARMPDGSTYFSIARTVIKPGGGHREPKSYYAIGLGCEVSQARNLVYADGMDLDDTGAAVPVGITCPLCERTDCRQRAFPSILPPRTGPRAGDDDVSAQFTDDGI